MTTYDLFSIGHSNIPPERFVALLQGAGVGAVVDVRSVPWSRFCPWFSQRSLESLLSQDRIGYLPMGDALGGRPANDTLYRDGVADYEAMARQPEFRDGLDRVIGMTTDQRICLMCAEREPLDCHRCLLVARAFAGRGLSVGHILHDAAIEAHTVTEQRLLSLDGRDDEPTRDLFATGQHDRLAAAYRRRARAVAFRRKVATPRAVEKMK
jgi:uncharacterized protein (DUF488 family)